MITSEISYILNKSAENYIIDNMDELTSLITKLCSIPAPSNHEEKRAGFCKSWFEKYGFKNVYIDSALNVVCPVNCENSKPQIIFMAHTDTVFPDIEPMPFTEDKDKMCCPGVGDDTANLAILMLCARYVLNNYPKGTPMLFAANSGEEGLGNLKGSQQLMQDYSQYVQEVISFDGTYGSICNKAVGSNRYKVEILTEGGHSYAKFGNKNAIHYLSSMITDLYNISLPIEDNSRTTYNVGVINGGTSVNTIAEQADMLYEFRTDSIKCLQHMEKTFFNIIESYRNKGVTVNVQLIGKRPCMGEVDENKFKLLQNRVAEATKSATGINPTFRSSSTDCNIPLSIGIPAVSTGAYLGERSHTRSEFIYKSSLPVGFRLAMTIITSYLYIERT